MTPSPQCRRTQLEDRKEECRARVQVASVEGTYVHGFRAFFDEWAALWWECKQGNDE